MTFRPLVHSLALALIAIVPSPAKSAVEWDAQVYPHEQLFPSIIIGTATVKPKDEVFPVWKGNHIGDPQGIIGAQVEGLPPGRKVALVIRENAVMSTSRVEGTSGEGDLTIYPKVLWRYDRLGRVRQTEPLDVTMELLVDGQSLGEKTVTATLRTVNDCLFGVEEGDGDFSDYAWLFAAYVNENHPWVDRTLKDALATGIVRSFDGYQSGDPDQVLQQIFAIWHVMQRAGMRYSDITTTGAEEEGVFSQHVRLFEESVTAAQANCVDGTVLLAAVLRKIGLRPSLVVLPRHMFLAVDLDDETTIGIETTMMGAELEPEAKKPRSNLGFGSDSGEGDESRENFEAAVAAGTETLEEAWEKIKSDDPDHQLIDLAQARSLGILPIRSAAAEAPDGP